MSEHNTLNTDVWMGRVDHDGDPELSSRWHQKVKSFHDYNGESGLALIGFACDEGVKRNYGRPGAADGPDAIRHCLANMPWNRSDSVYDFGNTLCSDTDLERAQTEFSQHIATALNNRLIPVGLGGGQEIAWASYKGLLDHLTLSRKSARGANIGVINLDAHLDLRKPEKGASSGTPFWQIAQHCEHQNLPFHYLCLGASRSSNTRALFDKADDLGAAYICDDQFSLDNLEFLIEEVECFTGMVDHVYLSIDMGVFSSSRAPGVSAPAIRGVPLTIVDTLLKVIKSSAKVRIMDVAELNPTYDHDSRTARLAAWVIHRFTEQDALT